MEHIVGDIEWVSLDDVAPTFIVDLHKAKKGSKKKFHKYIARFQVITLKGVKWRYVYPDEKDIKSWHPKKGLTLKRPISEIMNEYVFGSYGVDDKTGEPWVIPGKFFDYKPVNVNVKIPETGVQGFPGFTPERTIGKFRFYRMATQRGYLQLELGHGINSKVYKVPKKISKLKFDTPEDIEAARKLQPGYGIPQGGAVKMPADAPNLTDVPAPGSPSIFTVPPLSQQSKEALAAPKVSIGKEPVWVHDKFGTEAKYAEELADRPATTRVTLGIYDAKDDKIQEQLRKEWGGVIYNLARKAADAYKVTSNYKHYEEQDEKLGIISGMDTASATRAYLAEVTRDLVQHGYEALYQLALTYEASLDPRDRFDKLAYSAIKNTLYETSKKQAIIEGASPYDIVPEIATEAAASAQGAQWFLTPEEQSDLVKLTGPAKATLVGVMDDPSFPKSYKRVFMSRLWLDTEAATEKEKQLIHERAEAGGVKPKTVKLSTEEAAAPWLRPWTGPNSIAEAYDEWYNPEKGNTISMSALTPSMQTYYLQKFYAAAKENIHARMNKDERDMVARWLQLEAKLAGSNRRQYAERTKQTIREMKPAEFDTSAKKLQPKLVVLPYKPSPGQPKTTTAGIKTGHPAAEFFTSNNQKLARDLGISISAIDPKGGGGVFTTQNVASLGTHTQLHLDLAETYHKQVLDLQTWTHQKLTAKIKSADAQIKVFNKLGYYNHSATGTVWVPRKQGIDGLHAAASKFQALDLTITAKVRAQKKIVAYGKKHGETKKLMNQKLKPYKVTAAEKKAHIAAKKELQTTSKFVSKTFPGAVLDVFNAISSAERLTPGHLEEHKTQVHQAHSAARNYITLLRFERERRDASKAAKKKAKKAGIVLDLFKAIDDYDFELGRLYTAMAA